MLGLIKNFSAQEADDRGDAATFHLNADISNLSSSRTYEYLTILMYAARYPDDGNERFWTETRFIRYLGPGDRRHITAITGPVPKGEQIFLSIEIYWNRDVNGEPDDRADTSNIYAGGVVPAPAPVNEPVVAQPPKPQPPASPSGRSRLKATLIVAAILVVAGLIIWLLLTNPGSIFHPFA